MSIMPYPPGHDPRDAILSRLRPDWPDEEPDPDAVVDELRWRWRRGSFPPPVPGFDIAGGVGRGTRNARADVARLETLLHRAGHYDVSGTGGPTGYFGPPQEDAIRAYQKARGLTVDGLALPNGETLAALAREPEAPPPDGQTDTNEGASEATANRAPPDQEANAGAIIGRGALLGSALVGTTLWQQEQERQRKTGKPASRPNLLEFSLPRPANIFSGAPVPKANRDIVKDETPFHTGHPPPEVPDTSILSGPGTPMPVEQVPPTIRPDLKKKDFVEIFPDQSRDLPQSNILESRGGPDTENENTDALWTTIDKGNSMGVKLQHTNGGYHRSEGFKKELYIPGPNPENPKTGSVTVDGALRNPNTGRLIIVQTVTTKGDGTTMIDREAGAAERSAKLAPAGTLIVTIVKGPEGHSLDKREFAKFIEPIIEESNRPATSGTSRLYHFDKPLLKR